MAFNLTNFAPLGNSSKRGKASQHFTYWTLDAHATVDTAGYFNDVANMLSVGDVIHVVVWGTAVGTGTVSTYGTHIVNSNASGVVDVTNVTVGTVTDSD